MKFISALVTTLLASSANAAFISSGNVINNGDGTFILSTDGVQDSQIELDHGLATGFIDLTTITSQTSQATTGSAIGNTININKGDNFGFNWLWQTSEEPDLLGFNDFAFVVLQTVDTTLLADTFTPTNTTGTFSWQSDIDGPLTYSIINMNVGDTNDQSVLTVSNITPSSVAISEPPVWAIFGLAMVSISAFRRQRSA